MSESRLEQALRTPIDYVEVRTAPQEFSISLVRGFPLPTLFQFVRDYDKHPEGYETLKIVSINMAYATVMFHCEQSGERLDYPRLLLFFNYGDS